MYHTVDGNFHQNQKIKPLDADDYPLSHGGGYFANEEDFQNFQALLGEMEPEVCTTISGHLTKLTKSQPTTCHKFAAMGYGGYWGKISGTVGLCCARHMFVLPGGGVDLQKGER